MKQVSKSVIVDGKEIFVFRVCECEAVVATNLEEAVNYYKNYTGLGDDDIYIKEEIEKLDLNDVVLIEEESSETSTLLIEMKKNGYEKPYIICSW